MKKYIGIDLGGTNIALGIVSEAMELMHQIAVPTKAGRSGQAVMADIIEAAYLLLRESGYPLAEIQSIGIGVPGTANKETGVLEYANNLNMDGIPFTRILEKEFKKKILFENDAKAAAWAEYLGGTGKGSRSFVMMTLGTGVGGGMILNGNIYQGYNFAAGELGHMVIAAGGRPCTCGRRGCLEAYASATALIAEAKAALREDSQLWSLCEGNQENINGKLIFQAARQQDTLAKQILTRYIEMLAVGCINIINILQPEVLCIGGGISQSEDLWLSPLKKLVDEGVYTRNAGNKTRLTAAALHNNAGIIGAALLPD